MLFKSRKSYILNFALVLTLLSGLLGVGSVKAVTYTVTNVNDSGLGSLRQAIANAGSGDTITFDATLAGQTITLVSNLIINKDLTIDGSGLSSQITISGGNVAHVEVSLSRIVTISDLTIVNGYTSGDGGAVKSSGELTIINSTLRNNHAIGEGGAIDSLGLTLKNSTIYQNQSDSSGGAISIYGNGFHTIVNSTVTQNQAGDSGGAIYIHGNLDVQISNSTFAGNNSASEGKEIMLIGNGILYLQNIIFVCTSPENNDCYVSFGSGGIQYANDSILGFGTFADFGLDELADNGGSTNTMALLLGSLAIDAGNNASCPATDQRNIARPQGNGCDMGAFEYTEGPIVTVTPSPVSPTPTRTPTNTETLVPSLTPTKTPTHTSTSTGTYTSTPTPTNTQTVSPTPVTSCNQITPGPITISGNSMSMVITNPLAIPIQIQDVFVVWNHDKGHLAGADKTLNLTSVSLAGNIWSGASNGPSLTITPTPTAYIPTGTSTITFTFHQSYDFFDGSEQIFINLATNGCQSYPIVSNSIATNTPTFTPTNTSTPTATPPYSYNPLYLSLSGNQTIGGVTSADEDILKFDGTNWSLFFDGSDVGVGNSDLFGFSIVDADIILMAFSSAVTVNGLTVNPQDVVRFEATSFGTNTAGTFYMYLDGSDVGFDTTAEKIDSVGLLPDGRVLVSTTGNPGVVGVTGGKDEDVLAFTATSLGDETSGNWAMYFDGSDVGLADTSGEDVDALDVVNGKIYLSTADNFAVNGAAGADEDVFVCEVISLGDVTACNYSPILYFDGSTWGLSANDVDAFNYLSVGPVPTNVPVNTPTHTPTPTNTSTPTHTFTPGPSLTPTDTPTNTPTVTATFTPTATSTLGLSDQIFADGFESGNLSAWTSSAINGGDLSVSASAALKGNRGLQALINDNNIMSVTDESPSAEPRYRVRFYFDPNSITMASGDSHFIFKAFMGTSTEVVRLEFRQFSGAYQIRPGVFQNDSSWVYNNWVTISDAPHSIELDWRAASASGAGDGYLTMWVDAGGQMMLAVIDNSGKRIDSARLGALTGIDNGTRGTYYFDAFESRRQNYIGP